MPRWWWTTLIVFQTNLWKIHRHLFDVNHSRQIIILITEQIDFDRNMFRCSKLFVSWNLVSVICTAWSLKICSFFNEEITLWKQWYIERWHERRLLEKPIPVNAPPAFVFRRKCRQLCRTEIATGRNCVVALKTSARLPSRRVPSRTMVARTLCEEHGALNLPPGLPNRALWWLHLRPKISTQSPASLTSAAFDTRSSCLVRSFRNLGLNRSKTHSSESLLSRLESTIT